jgi:hypothetical protein
MRAGQRPVREAGDPIDDVGQRTGDQNMSLPAAISAAGVLVRAELYPESSIHLLDRAAKTDRAPIGARLVDGEIVLLRELGSLSQVIRIGSVARLKRDSIDAEVLNAMTICHQVSHKSRGSTPNRATASNRSTRSAQRNACAVGDSKGRRLGSGGATKPNLG